MNILNNNNKNRALIQLAVRRDTTENLKNHILEDGEPGYATDTHVFLIGDGVHRWEDLYIRSTFADYVKFNSSINGLEISNDKDVVNFGICQTLGGNSTKQVSIPGFKLISGAVVNILFKYNNISTQKLTLNINDSGDFPIIFNNSTLSMNFIKANQIYTFIYINNENNTSEYRFIGQCTGIAGNSLTINSKGELQSNIELKYNQSNNCLEFISNGQLIQSLNTSEFKNSNILKSVNYNKDTKMIEFVWNLNDTEDKRVTKIDIQDLFLNQKIDISNIIIPQDLYCNVDFGSYKCKSSPTTIKSKGESLYTLLSGMLKECKQPLFSDMIPKFEFDILEKNYQTNIVKIGYTGLDTYITGEDNTEIGNFIKGANYNVKFTSGVYPYGYWKKNLNGDFEEKVMVSSSTDQIATYVISSNDIAISKIEGEIDFLGKKENITFLSPIQIISENNSHYGKILNTITYANKDNNRYPLNSCGELAQYMGQYIQPVSGGKVTESRSIECAGHRSCYYYIGSDCFSQINSKFIRNSVSTCCSFTPEVFGKVKIFSKSKRVLFAVPGIHKKIHAIDENGLKIDMGKAFKRKEVHVEGANKFSSAIYTVFDFIKPEGIMETEYTITIED